MTQDGTDNTMLDALEDAYAEIPREREETTVDWYCRAMWEYNAQIAEATRGYEVRQEHLKGAHERLVALIEEKRRSIIHRHEEEVKAAAWLEIEGQRHKYVQTPWGRVQFRKQPAKDRVEVDDEEVAVEAALKSCPSAVSTRHKLLVSMLDGFELPGTHLVHADATTSFEYKPNRPKETDNACEDGE